MNEFPDKNLGLIEEIRPTDFLAGTLPYKIVLPSGNWRPFLPPGEPQYSQVADSRGCVTFSNNNLVEIQLKQQGFTENFSDRYLAKTSNTTLQGNTFGIVEDAARKFGRVKEDEWPIPATFTWDAFYSDIPQEVKDKAVFFDEAYEFIGTDVASLTYHLKQAPIQIAIPLPHPNHAVVLVALEGTTAFYFDSYPGSTNYLKTMDVGLISAAMKLIIKKKENMKYLIDEGGKIGVLVTEGFTFGGGFAKDPKALADLKSAFEVPDNAPIIKLS